MGVVALICDVCEETVGTLNRDAFEAMALAGEVYVCRHCESLDGAVIEDALQRDPDGQRWAELTRAAMEAHDGVRGDGDQNARGPEGVLLEAHATTIQRDEEVGATG